MNKLIYEYKIYIKIYDVKQEYMNKTTIISNR